MSEVYEVRFEKSGEDKWDMLVNAAEGFWQQNEASDYLVYSEFNGVDETMAFINDIDFNRHIGFYVFGCRNTVLIEEIMKRKTMYSTLTIFEVIEGDAFTLYCSEYFVKNIRKPNIQLIIGEASFVVSKMPEILSSVDKIYNMKNVEIITTPTFKSEFPKRSVELPKQLLEFMEYQSTGLGNSVEDILMGVDNMLNCWNHYLKGQFTNELKDAYKGIPAVIVGAGPSLDKNVRDLEAIKDKALVFAVDAAIDTLDNVGFVPDSFTTLERTDETLRFYERHSIPEEVCFVGANTIVPEVLEEYERLLFTGRRGDGFFRAFSDALGNNSLDIGMNVANVPFSFAKHLGCDPIILVGLDLAYTGGETHVKDISDNMTDDIKHFYDNYKTFVEDQEGNMVETYIYFQYAKTWFEKRLSQDTDINCYNATEGGANIRGAKNVTLKGMIDQLSDRPDLEERLYQKYDRLNRDVEEKRVMTKAAGTFMKELEDAIDGLVDQAHSSKEYLTDNEKFGRVHRVEESRHKIDQVLQTSTELRFLYQPIYVDYNRSLHSFPVFLDTDTEEKLIEVSMNYYNNLIEVGAKLKETIKIYKDILDDHMRLLGGDLDA